MIESSFHQSICCDHGNENTQAIETKYQEMDQVKFVKDNFEKFWSNMVCLNKIISP